MADAPAPPRESTGSGLNKKIAGQPIWLWTTVGAAGAVIVWVWLRNRKSTKAGQTDSTTNPQYTPSGNEGLSTSQYEDLLAQLRDLQGSQSQDLSVDKEIDKDVDKTPKPKPGSGEDESGSKEFRDVRITTNGRQSLNQIAAAHHTSAASIVSATQRHHGVTGKFARYVHKHHFTVKVPAGVSLWIREEQ